MSRSGDRQLQHSPSFHTGCMMGRRTTLSLAFIPNLCCALEQVGTGSEKGLAQQGTGFGRVLGRCSPPGFPWASILLKRCQWRSFSAVCDPHVPGLHFQSSLSPWFVLLCSLGSLTLHTRHCLSSSGCPCASVSVPVQPAPALPTCFCHSFSAETFSLGRSHQSTEQLPELGSVCPAQGAITRAHVGSRISRKKHHP